MTNIKPEKNKICERCGKNFYVPNCKCHRKYCSKECYSLNQKKIRIKNCEICDNEFEVIGFIHKERRCCSKECSKILQYSDRKKLREDIWNKEQEIINLYRRDGFSTVKIGEMFNTTPSTIGVILKKNNVFFEGYKLDIKKNGNEIKKLYNSGKSIIKIAKKFECSDKLIREILEKEGIKIKTGGDYRKGTISNKKNKTYEELYGEDKAREIKETYKEKRKDWKSPIKDTSIEIKIQNFLKQLGIEFFTHQHMNIEHRYQCDIFIPSMNLVIECDGNYWHKYPTGTDIDHIRTSELITKGFRILRLWEIDIKKMDLNDFKERINK